MKVIVDTNVIIDALTGREPWNVEAEQIFELAAISPDSFWVTANVITDIYYVLNKLIKEKNFVRECFGKLLDLFGILDCKGENCIAAYHSDMKDFEDAILSEIARKNEVDYIITRNVKDFVESKVKAIEPKEFLVLLKKIE